MPIYTWRCSGCERLAEVMRRVADYQIPLYCHPCGGKIMSRELTPPMVTPDIAPYRALTGDRMGQMITSRKDHREFLKRNRLVELGTEKPKDTSKMRSIRTAKTRRELRAQLKPVISEAMRRGQKQN